MLSLVLFLVTVVLWVRSYWFGSQVVWWTGRTTISATVNRGTIYLVRYDARYDGQLPPDWVAALATPAPPRLTPESLRAYNVGSKSGPLGFDYADGTRASTLSDPPGVRRTQRWRTLLFP